MTVTSPYVHAVQAVPEPSPPVPPSVQVWQAVSVFSLKNCLGPQQEKKLALAQHLGKVPAAHAPSPELQEVQTVLPAVFA